MSAVSYQLVLQFPEAAFSDFDAVVRYEDSLLAVFGDRHEVDGHDMGSGEVNFFVITDDPQGALMEIRGSSGGLLSHPDLRVAARPTNADVYEPLWPVGDPRPFTLV